MTSTIKGNALMKTTGLTIAQRKEALQRNFKLYQYGGAYWYDTSDIQKLMTPQQFRQLECEVATYHPNGF